MILFMIVMGFFTGLIGASFLMIAAWFAWTPLPMIFRVPLALLLIAPFGLLAAASGTGSSLAAPIFLVLWLGLFFSFVADRSASYAVCLVGLVVLGVLPIVFCMIFNPATIEPFRWNLIGFWVVVMMTIATLCVPVRLQGYRLERISPDASDQTMRLMTDKTIDQWIRHFDAAFLESKQKDENSQPISFAEAMRTMRCHGVPEHSAKIAAKSLFRAMGRPSPRLAMGSLDGGLASMIQWATTGPSREQYSLVQMMLWVASAAILFAALARTGIDPQSLLYWIAGIPAMLAAAIALMLLGFGWLMANARSHRFLAICGGCLLLGMASMWVQSMQVLPPRLIFLVTSTAVGIFGWLSYWMFHLRREGFRLLGNASRGDLSGGSRR